MGGRIINVIEVYKEEIDREEGLLRAYVHSAIGRMAKEKLDGRAIAAIMAQLLGESLVTTLQWFHQGMLKREMPDERAEAIGGAIDKVLSDEFMRIYSESEGLTN